MRNGRSRSLDGEHIAVVGLAASGRAAARLALERGGTVHVSDLRSDASAHARGDELRGLGVDVDLGTHPIDRIAAAGIVVVSPGIPPDAPVLRALSERGVRWVSEPEFAFRFFDGPLIVVTGTNGKTTTAALVAHLLESDGQDVALGGNIGQAFGPAASELALRDKAPAWYVVEMSSFQLANIDRLRPDIGVVTNLAPDHLDRYESVDEYYADKANLFRNADQDSRWVLNGDDTVVLALAGDAPGERYTFSTKRTDGRGAYLDGDDLTLEMIAGQKEALIPVDRLGLLGAHNIENALAAATVASLAHASTAAIQRGLATARPLPHRTEQVAEGKGIRWINDSKATNVAATERAVTSLEGPLIVLLGGKDKDEDFARLVSALVEVDARVFAFGQAGPRIEQALRAHVQVERIDGGFDQVIEAAAAAARPGDVVLLSPACSSFDMFENYEDRGKRFSELARALATEEAR